MKPLRKSHEIYPVLIITGATATGKTEFSVSLARELQKRGLLPHVISADSGQVYREMDIGTAKVPKSIRKEIPHHLIDVINPDQRFSAFMFVKEASRIIKEGYRNHRENFVPMIVGGTAFYIEALLKGLVEGGNPDEEIRKELEEIDQNELYAKLKKEDPDYASKISPKDRKRTIRAMEYILKTGKKYSEALKERKPPITLAPFMIITELPGTRLKHSIGKRAEAMLQKGWIEETSRIMEKYGTDCPGLNQVGYQQIKEFLSEQTPRSKTFEYKTEFKPEGMISLRRKIITATWHVARRQITFLKRFGEFQPIRIDPGEKEVTSIIAEKFLSFRTPFQPL